MERPRNLLTWNKHVQLLTLLGPFAQVQFVSQETEFPLALISVEFCPPTPEAVRTMLSGELIEGLWGHIQYSHSPQRF